MMFGLGDNLGIASVSFEEIKRGIYLSVYLEDAFLNRKNKGEKSK
jgi:hypothetical protein